MIDYLGMVKEFHKKYGHHTINSPGRPLDEIVELRHKLITEEAIEFYDASDMLLNTLDTPLSNERYIIEIADAIADLLYVVFGAALAYGIPIERVFAEVHRSNMTKSTEKNVHGKTIKGDAYEPPRIKEVLFVKEPRTAAGSLD